MRSGALPARTKENHATHLLTVKENPALTHCYGVKNACPLTENLSYFHCVIHPIYCTTFLKASFLGIGSVLQSFYLKEIFHFQ